MHTTLNATSFRGNRSQHQIPRGVFSPASPDSRSPKFSGSRPRTRSVTRLELAAQPQSDHQSPPSSLPAVAEVKWTPSIALGSALWLEGEELSRIEIADRKITQRRLWADHYRGVADFPAILEEAVEERRQLDPTIEESTMPISSLASTGALAVAERITILRTALASSEFPPERENITAAINGYNTDAIPYSSFYTLIWAGRIVDRCSDYSSFTDDRAARLDRYSAAHGPGWLWHEPPLSGSSSVRGPIATKKAICLENKPSWRRATNNMGHYTLTMGFQRRKAAVHRAAPFTHLVSLPSKPGCRPKTQHQPPITEPDPEGPTVFWNTLLDCGATYPCLFEGDLSRLGISRRAYAAQSIREVATADEVKPMRMYEVDVSITSTPTPSQTGPPSVLGTLTIPVVALSGSAADDLSSPATAPDRLSGIVPFHMFYLSSAPGAFKLWLGNERRDVLGAARFPRRNKIGQGVRTIPRPSASLLETTPGLGTPTRVVFEHELADGSLHVVRDTEEEGGGSLSVSGQQEPRSAFISLEEPGKPKTKKGRLTRGTPVERDTCHEK